MLGECIARGALTAGVATMPGTQLLAMWQQAEAARFEPTKTEVLGPFYKKGAPDTRTLRQPGDPGFALRVTGRVMNTRGEKLPGARIDVWHTNYAGRYDLEGYRYRAQLVVQDEAEYGIDTVIPGHYPDRPAQHIHYLIKAPGHKPLITQAYFSTDPYFDGDPDKNYAKGRIVRHRELVRPLKLYEEGSARAEMVFDLILEQA
jgi:catechol 1,2-dioxygenase